jgi:hypothetical protein
MISLGSNGSTALEWLEKFPTFGFRQRMRVTAAAATALCMSQILGAAMAA